MPASTAFSQALAGLATQTVTHRSVTGINAYGEISSVTSDTASAYVQRVWDADRDLERDGRTIDYRIYIPSSTLVVEVDDEMTVDGVTRRVVEVGYRYDEHGAQCTVVHLGSA